MANRVGATDSAAGGYPPAMEAKPRKRQRPIVPESFSDSEDRAEAPAVQPSTQQHSSRQRFIKTPGGIEDTTASEDANKPTPTWRRVAQVVTGLMALGACITIVALCVTGAFATPLYMPLAVTGFGLIASFAIFAYLTYLIDRRQDVENDEKYQAAIAQDEQDIQQAVQNSLGDGKTPLTRANRRKRKKPPVVITQPPQCQEGGSTQTPEERAQLRRRKRKRSATGHSKRPVKTPKLVTFRHNFTHTEIEEVQKAAYQKSFTEYDLFTHKTHLFDVRDVADADKFSKLTPLTHLSALNAEIPALLQYNSKGSVYYQTPLVVRLPTEYINNMSISDKQKQELIESKSEFYFIVYRPDSGDTTNFRGSWRNLSFHGPLFANNIVEEKKSISMGMLYANGIQPVRESRSGPAGIPIKEMKSQSQEIHLPFDQFVVKNLFVKDQIQIVRPKAPRALANAQTTSQASVSASPNNAAFNVSQQPVDTFFACAKLDPKSNRSMAVFGVVLNSNEGDGTIINNAIKKSKSLNDFYEAIVANGISDQDVLKGGIGAALNLPHTAEKGAGVELDFLN